MTANYGQELILDMHDCNPKLFTRRHIRNYFRQLCKLIDMKRGKLCWWDDYRVPPKEQQINPKTKGTTAVQFMLTSNITIHTLVLLKRVYLNVFACKSFDIERVIEFSKKWFEGKVVNTYVIERK